MSWLASLLWALCLSAPSFAILTLIIRWGLKGMVTGELRPVFPSAPRMGILTGVALLINALATCDVIVVTITVFPSNTRALAAVDPRLAASLVITTIVAPLVTWWAMYFRAQRAFL